MMFSKAGCDSVYAIYGDRQQAILLLIGCMG